MVVRASSRFDLPVPLRPTSTVVGDCSSKSTAKSRRFLKLAIFSLSCLMSPRPRGSRLSYSGDSQGPGPPRSVSSVARRIRLPSPHQSQPDRTALLASAACLAREELLRATYGPWPAGGCCALPYYCLHAHSWRACSACVILGSVPAVPMPARSRGLLRQRVPLR